MGDIVLQPCVVKQLLKQSGTASRPEQGPPNPLWPFERSRFLGQKEPILAPEKNSNFPQATIADPCFSPAIPSRRGAHAGPEVFQPDRGCTRAVSLRKQPWGGANVELEIFRPDHGAACRRPRCRARGGAHAVWPVRWRLGRGYRHL